MKEEVTNFGIKDSKIWTSLAKKYFKSLRDENIEPIYNKNDEYLWYFVRQNLKGGRCSALNQYLKSIIFDENFKLFEKLSMKWKINPIVFLKIEKKYSHSFKYRCVFDNKPTDMEKIKSYFNDFFGCMQFKSKFYGSN